MEIIIEQYIICFVVTRLSVLFNLFISVLDEETECTLHLVSQSKIHQLKLFILLIILVLSFLRASEGIGNRLKDARATVQSLYTVSCTITADTWTWQLSEPLREGNRKKILFQSLKERDCGSEGC